MVGKRGGAFCSHGNTSTPVHVLLNHTNTIRDVMILAHEMGHAINFVMLKEKEGPLTYGSPTSIAEVASTFMEGFALDEILKTLASDEDKLALMIQRLNDEVSTIQRQIAFYQVEQELHTAFRKEGYLSADQI